DSYVFFFSSRRRHTRFSRDWSSDVCSSDLALTLTEAAAISTDQLHKGVLETFVNTSPILDRIPFETINGTALTYTMEDELPGVAWRGVNEAYPESTGAFARKSET